METIASWLHPVSVKRVVGYKVIRGAKQHKRVLCKFGTVESVAPKKAVKKARLWLLKNRSHGQGFVLQVRRSFVMNELTKNGNRSCENRSKKNPSYNYKWISSAQSDLVMELG